MLTKAKGIKTIYFDIEHKEENKEFITAYSWYDILNKIKEYNLFKTKFSCCFLFT